MAFETEEQTQQAALVAYSLAPADLAKIPASFLTQLREYRLHYSDEKPFRFEPGAGDGYGLYICGENGCFQSVKLQPRFGPDNGLAEGVGSFASIRDHIKSSAHRRCRNERLAREAKDKMKKASRPRPAPAAPFSSKPAGATVSASRALGPRKSLVDDLDALVNPVDVKPTINRSSGAEVKPIISQASSSKLDAKNTLSRPSSSTDVKPSKPTFNIKSDLSDDIFGAKPKASTSEPVSVKREPKVELLSDDDLPSLPWAAKKEPNVPSSSSSAVKERFAFDKKPSLPNHLTPATSIRGSPASIANVKPTPSPKPTTSAHLVARATPKPLMHAQTAAVVQRAAMPGLWPAPPAFPLPPPPPPGFPYNVPYIPAYNRVPAAPAADRYTAEAASMIYGGNAHAGAYNSDEDDDMDPEALINVHSRYDAYDSKMNSKERAELMQQAIESSDFEGTTDVGTARKELGFAVGAPARIDGFAEDFVLMPHQIIGVCWMNKQEQNVRHRGGIMADEMGLGKTVQMISQMLMNPPEDPREKTTLILAPLALLEQWKNEIEDRTESGRFSVLIYHGNGRKNKKTKDLMKFDVILTTYQTMALEWIPDDALAIKRKNKKKAGVKQEMDDFVSEDDVKPVKSKNGPLVSMNFHRIVLDEAQNIRNKNTRTSRAVLVLKATYRWCLTGTPLTNSLSDAFPLFRFLRLRPYCDWVDFRDHIQSFEAKKPQLASQRLQVIFKTCLFRRKKTSLLDGKPLIVLPEKHVKLEELTFSVEEREVYDIIEKRAQVTINKYIRAGTVLKNYAHVFSMLTRLRQVCAHPALTCENWFAEAFADPDTEGDRIAARAEIQRAADLVGAAFVAKAKATLLENMLARIAAEKAGTEMPEPDECIVCLEPEPHEHATILPCHHRFCTACVHEVLAMGARVDGDAEEGGGMKADERPCPTCRAPFDKERCFNMAAFEPTDLELGVVENNEDLLGKPDDEVMDVDAESEPDEVVSDGEYQPKKRRALSSEGDDDEKPVYRRGSERTSRKVTRKAVIDDSDDDSDDSMDDFVVPDDVDEDDLGPMRKPRGKKRKSGGGDVDVDEEEPRAPRWKTKSKKKSMKQLMKLLPPKALLKKSVKMERMLALLEEAHEASDGKDKTIIFSQWTSALDLYACSLEEKGIRYVRYQGDMKREERADAIRLFSKNRKFSVMLMSLKCGGVGLTLCAANRVISLDLAWSPAIEAQAFDRCHRMGQTKEVFVERLVIANTVEQRILEKQKQKGLLIDESLGEGTGRKLQRLTVADIAALFGMNA